MIFVIGFFIAKYLYNIWDDDLKNIGGFYLLFTIIELFSEFLVLLDFLAK